MLTRLIIMFILASSLNGFNLFQEINKGLKLVYLKWNVHLNNENTRFVYVFILRTNDGPKVHRNIGNSPSNYIFTLFMNKHTTMREISTEQDRTHRMGHKAIFEMMAINFLASADRTKLEKSLELLVNSKCVSISHISSYVRVVLWRKCFVYISL